TTRVEVDAVTRRINVATFFQGADHVDLFWNVISGLAYDVRGLDVQLGGVIEKCFRVFLGDIPGRQPFTLRPYFELVVTVITVVSQMTNVRDVHDVLEIVTSVLEYSTQ